MIKSINKLSQVHFSPNISLNLVVILFFLFVW